MSSKYRKQVLVWFLYDRDLLHERVNVPSQLQIKHMLKFMLESYLNLQSICWSNNEVFKLIKCKMKPLQRLPRGIQVDYTQNEALKTSERAFLRQHLHIGHSSTCNILRDATSTP